MSSKMMKKIVGWSQKRTNYTYTNKLPHFSNKRYGPYHEKLQKKQYRYSFDYASSVDKKDNLIEVGINKEYYYIDDYANLDGYKDGN